MSEITTAEALDALPDESAIGLVRRGEFRVFRKVGGPDAEWLDERGVVFDEDWLPATVLFRPDAPTPTPAGDDREDLALVLERTEESGAWARTEDADLYGALADAALAWFATRSSVPTVEQMTEVLVAHQRQGSHSCLCGDLPLGSSFAQHQAEQIAALWVTP